MLFVIAIISAVVWHFFLHRFWVSCVLSTLTSTLVTWSLFVYHFGTFDDYWVKNMALTLVVSFLSAIVIGSIFLYVRKTKGQ